MFGVFFIGGLSANDKVAFHLYNLCNMSYKITIVFV